MNILFLGSLDFAKEGKKTENHLEENVKESQICADRDNYHGKVAKKFVGTFKNGTLQGPGMVVFQDDITLITNFEKGRLR